MTAILLIHGGWIGPWCWDQFAGRLADRGHDVRAMRLRGHDQQPGRIWHRIEDYLDDVRQAAAGFDEPPVLVGHSMGGLLAQKHLERYPARGAVLLASIPTGGTASVVARLSARHPLAMLKANLLLSLRPLVATTALVRELFFTTHTPQHLVDTYNARVQDESYLAFIDMLAFARPGAPERVRAPVLVIGAEMDGIISVAEVQRTARAYGVEPLIVPGMGHTMMLEEGWQEVADRVDAWVRQIG